MNINTTTAVITASNAADSGSVNPVLLWVFAIITAVAVIAFFGPVAVDIVKDTARSLRFTLRSRRPATR